MLADQFLRCFSSYWHTLSLNHPYLACQYSTEATCEFFENLPLILLCCSRTDYLEIYPLATLLYLAQNHYMCDVMSKYVAEGGHAGCEYWPWHAIRGPRTSWKAGYWNMELSEWSAYKQSHWAVACTEHFFSSLGQPSSSGYSQRPQEEKRKSQPWSYNSPIARD